MIWLVGKLKFINFTADTDDEITNKIVKKTGTDGDYLVSTDNNFFKIPAGEFIEIKYEAKPRGDLGENITNTAYVYSYVTKDLEYGHTQATTQLKKNVTIAKAGTTSSDKYNVIMVLDNSWSLGTKLSEIRNAARNLVGELKNKGEVTIKYVKFSGSADEIKSLNEYSGTLKGGTNYKDALEEAKILINTDSSVENIVVFMSDGCPTLNIVPTFDGFFGKLWNSAIANLLNTISGGWLELVWKGFDDYGFRLLVTFGNTVDDHLYNWAKNTSVSYNVWNEIMKEVKEIKENVNQFYTVYFRSNVGDEEPIYGLKQMATASNETYFKDAKSIDELKTKFSEIVQSSFPTAPSLYENKEYKSNTIRIETGITKIEVDGIETEFSAKISNIDGGMCDLDISSWLDKDITIIY